MAELESNAIELLGVVLLSAFWKLGIINFFLNFNVNIFISSQILNEKINYKVNPSSIHTLCPLFIKCDFVKVYRSIYIYKGHLLFNMGQGFLVFVLI